MVICDSGETVDTGAAGWRTLLRGVNDGILEIGRGWGLDGCPISFRCECGFDGCADEVSLLEDEYVRIAASDELFIVAPAHRRQAHGDVVRRVAKRAIVVRDESPSPVRRRVRRPH